jgi:hypothetical protein
MGRLEDLKPSATVRGILPNCLVSVISAQWFGSEALELTYKDPTGKVGNDAAIKRLSSAQLIPSKVA